MPFDLYTRLLSELERPSILRLSYSGESGHYPRLMEALDLAKATGARVELVTALVSVPKDIVRMMAQRLDRITVSVHTTEDNEFRRIYRYGSFDGFARRLDIVDQVRRERGEPKLDFCFVAMDSNLSSLDGVVRLARDRYVSDVFVQPVMRREEFEYAFPELDGEGKHHEPFAAALHGAVDTAQSRYSGVNVRIVHPELENAAANSGEIIQCSEDPWQTLHVMSNGDVISCGWRQARPLGNLHSESLLEIWKGQAYETFRSAHREARDPICRRCAFKKSYTAEPLERRITEQNLPSRQMPAGWLGQDAAGMLWAGSDAVLELPGNSSALHLIGGLPPGSARNPNTLTITVGGTQISTIENRSEDHLLHFDRVLRLPINSIDFTRVIEFRTRHEYVPRDHGHSGDRRRLGFCLKLAECVEEADGQPDCYWALGLDPECRRLLNRLRAALVLTDAVAPVVRLFTKQRSSSPARPGQGSRSSSLNAAARTCLTNVWGRWRWPAAVGRNRFR